MKKNMTKWLTLLLAGAMLIGMTGCGEADSDGDNVSSKTGTSAIESTSAIQTVVTTYLSEMTTDLQTTIVSETTKAPEITTKAPETTQAPETTKATETTQAPVTTQVPVTTKAPENTTKVPETTKAPIVEVPVVDNNYFFNDTNNYYDIDAVSIRPRYVYWDNGKLVAECFVINGFAHSVYNIDVESLSFSNGSGLIAEGAFGSLNGLTLAPYTYAIWTFTFSGDAVAAYGADLSWLNCHSSVNNRY